MGNTQATDTGAMAVGDHPHIHGEYFRWHLHILKALGSPPYTWGIPRIARFLNDGTRITPIYMGNTPNKSMIVHALRDHPHIHGEYHLFGATAAANLGSPPYTWGILLSDDSVPDVMGITPIYMGNTCCH